MEKVCQKHGLTKFYKSPSQYSARCLRCNVERVTHRRRQVKLLLIKAMGGRCEICGYDKCAGALHFHHIDPSQKSFGISDKGVTRGYRLALEEAKKCRLLCSNCHMEEEWLKI